MPRRQSAAATTQPRPFLFTLGVLAIWGLWDIGDTYGALIDLKPAETTGDVVAVKVVLEVTGDLLSKDVNKPDSQAVKHPLKAVGNLTYEEQLEDVATRRSLRYYEQAQADLDVDGQTHSVELREDRRWVRATAELGDVAVLSLQGGLTRAELDLLEVPGGSHLVTVLLPDKPVNVGDRWPLADEHLARLFNLEGVSTQDLQGELKSVEKDEARMELSGKLLGSVDGVITELSIRAKYTFDLQQRRITWVAMAIQENRPAGLAAPGLQVTARLRMAVGPAAPPRFLVSEAVSQLNREGSAAGALLEYRSPGEDFVLLLDRHWYVMQQQPQLSVLRWVEDDQFVAQCTLKSLPGLGDKKPPTLADFQRDIKRALGESVQQVVDAREAELVDGLRSLKVIVAGRVGDAPIQWIYYHLSHSSGRCLACVFTLSAEEVERFGGEDITLASSVLFLDGPTEPAAPVKAAAADAVQR